MDFPRRSPFVAAAVLAGATLFAAAACGPPPPPPAPTGGPTADPGTTTAPTTEPTGTSTGTIAPAPTASVTAGPFVCKLPEPVKSADTCRTDADCAPSEPCHAHACVAKAKAHLPDKSTICTRMMDCHSADANPCGCFEGVCALVPPN